MEGTSEIRPTASTSFKPASSLDVVKARIAVEFRKIDPTWVDNDTSRPSYMLLGASYQENGKYSFGINGTGDRHDEWVAAMRTALGDAARG